MRCLFLSPIIPHAREFTSLGPNSGGKKATVSFVMAGWMSVRPSEWNDSALTERILMKFDIRVFFENLSRKFNFH